MRIFVAKISVGISYLLRACALTSVFLDLFISDETLGVDKDATQKEIRKAYMKLSRTHHPDKGGDEHKFKEISAA